MINSIQRDQRRRLLVLRFQAKRVQCKALLQNYKVALQLSKKQEIALKKVRSLQTRKDSRGFVRTRFQEAIGTPSQRSAVQKEMIDLHRNYTSPKIPRNGSVTRTRNRCVSTARGRGVLRFCKLSRIRLRELAAQGKLNGVSKASW